MSMENYYVNVSIIVNVEMHAHIQSFTLNKKKYAKLKNVVISYIDIYGFLN